MRVGLQWLRRQCTKWICIKETEVINRFHIFCIVCQHWVLRQSVTPAQTQCGKTGPSPGPDEFRSPSIELNNTSVITSSQQSQTHKSFLLILPPPGALKLINPSKFNPTRVWYSVFSELSYFTSEHFILQHDGIKTSFTPMSQCTSS